MFLERFLLSNLCSAGLICLMLAVKWLLRERLSLRFQYRSWYVLLFSLMLSFLPGELLGSWSPAAPVNGQTFAMGSASGDAVGGTQWLQDTTQLVQTGGEGQAAGIVLTLWLTGVLALLGVYLCGGYRLRRVRREAAYPPERIRSVFEVCRGKLRLKREVGLLQSASVASPISFGIGSPCVILPQKGTQELSEAELEHILLHELTHIRHGDPVTNLLFCGAQALFWCNPFVWFAFRRMRRDREAYCDWVVLSTLSGEEERLCYGQTILRFAAGNHVRFSAANGLCQSRDQLKYRLERIVDFRAETKGKRIGGRLLAAALALVSLCQIPVLALCTDSAGEYYDPSATLSMTEGDWDDLFPEGKGCAVVYDLNGEHYTVYNREEITRRVPPCSTYKIYSALNALELGVITPEDNALSWDSVRREFEAWNRDQDLASAMGNSANWYFQTLDRAAGAERLEAFYQRIGYGNCEIGGDILNYWNGSALKISALEQVELLVKLYRNEFGFGEANIAAVKEALKRNDGELYGKTGTGRLDGADVAGWFVGFEQAQGNVYFFAVYLCSEHGADGTGAMEIALEILERMK